jgi:hypothetical protein
MLQYPELDIRSLQLWNVLAHLTSTKAPRYYLWLRCVDSWNVAYWVKQDTRFTG